MLKAAKASKCLGGNVVENVEKPHFTLNRKNNDQDSITAAQTLEKTVIRVIEAGITTKDVGGNMSTREFTKEITNRLVS